MNARSTPTFALAGRDDERGLRELLARSATEGNVRLTFRREPDYFAGENVAGGRDATLVCRLADRVVSLGRCTRRSLYVGGVPREVGYLAELRLAGGTPGAAAVLREGYARLAEVERSRPGGPADAYFTSIADSNARGRRVLESGRLGLPRYRPLAELVTIAWPVPRRPIGREETIPEATTLEAFLDACARRATLAAPWPAGSLASHRPHGLEHRHFRAVVRDGCLVAVGAVWDQSAWRQTVVEGYGRALSGLRPVLNLCSRLRGRPPLPAPGSALRLARVHPLHASPEASPLELVRLLEALEGVAAAGGLSWLSATVPLDDPVRSAAQSRPGAHTYRTRLHSVHWSGGLGGVIETRDTPIRPDAGFL